MSCSRASDRSAAGPLLASLLTLSCGWAGASQAFATRSDGHAAEVLIVDVAGNGIALQSAATGPRVRLPDGQLEQMGWTAPGTDDALLVVEQQENGRIDSLGELLGWQGPPNGFDYLRALDGTSPSAPARRGRPVRSPDGRIDAADAVFARLVLWTDADASGTSTSAEVQSVTYAGFVSFLLDVQRVARTIGGNQLVQVGRASRLEGGTARDVDVAAVRLALARPR